MTRGALAIADKELRLLLRDPLFVVMQLAFPLLLLVVFGALFSITIRAVPLAVADRDGGPAARALVRRLEASGTFRPFAADPRAALAGGAAPAGLVVTPTGVQLVVDGSSGTARAAAAALAAGADTAAPTAEVATLTWYNPARRDALFFVPGVIALLLFAGAGIFPGLALVREKDQGAWLGLAGAPVGDAELLLGKLAPYVVQLIVVGVLIFADAALGFGVPCRGNPGALAAGTLLLLLAGVGVGASIGALAPAEPAAWRLLLIAVVLPGFVLSGFIYPLSSMPAVAQGLSWLFPVRAYLELERAVLLKGAGVADVARQLAALAAYAAVGTAAAIACVRRARRSA